MKSLVIVDTGALVALINQQDSYHTWAKSIWAQIRPPLLTCDAVIVESCFLLRNSHNGERTVFQFLNRGILQLSFNLAEEHATIQKLMTQYQSVPMSVADACLVRMSERLPNSMILTIDSDFTIYRKNRNQTIATLMPDR